MTRRRRVTMLGGAAVLVVGLAGCTPWRSKLVSVNSAGSDSGNAVSERPLWSPAGGRVAFQSRATNLGPPDLDGAIGIFGQDVFVRDLTTGTTTMVSANAAGTDSGNSVSFAPTWSPDGTRVAFFSDATNLGPPDTNHDTDLFLRDLASGTTTMVSVNQAGTDSAGGAGFFYDFSPDGTAIAFVSGGAGFGPTDPGAIADVYVRDLTAGTTSLESINPAGTGGGNGHSLRPEFSPDGARVAFQSAATDLDPAAPGLSGIYERNLGADTTTLIVPFAESQPAYGPDGTTMMFTTHEALVPADANAENDVYLKDLTGGGLTLVSAVDGAADPVGAAYYSPDGTKVLYESHHAGTDDPLDLHLYDVASGTDIVMAVGAGTPPVNPFDTASGKVVYHTHDADGFSTRVFAYDIAAGTKTLISGTSSGANPGPGQSFGETLEPGGARVAFQSDLTTFGPADTNGAFDIYVASIPPPAP
jgi:Tol biopolymer transport system component